MRFSALVSALSLRARQRRRKEERTHAVEAAMRAACW